MSLLLATRGSHWGRLCFDRQDEMMFGGELFCLPGPVCSSGSDSLVMCV